MKKSDIAIANFKSGFICSSAVLSTFSDELGLADETAKNCLWFWRGGIKNGQHLRCSIRGGSCHRAEIWKASPIPKYTAQSANNCRKFGITLDSGSFLNHFFHLLGKLANPFAGGR
jgi:hypothetical protein